jgi:mannose-1-phosphate guanylyltransferase
MFAARAYLRELESRSAATVAACKAALAQARREGALVALGDAFRDSPAASIDYAIMEHTTRAAVVPLAAGWSDVGSWSALHDALDKDPRGNVARGNVRLEDCRHTYAVSTGRLVAVVGLEGVIVVETPDAVLVVSREHAQSVKRMADAMTAEPKATGGSRDAE